MNYEEVRDKALLVLDYNDDSGQFVWRVKMGSSGPGRVAGHLNRALGYVVIGFGGKNYYAHRLAWMMRVGDPEGFQIDHIDGDKSNNRLVNLRLADMRQNQQNLTIHGRRESSLIGAYPGKSPSTWHAKIKVMGKQTHLGSFASEQEAHEAYVAARNRFFGEFAPLRH